MAIPFVTCEPAALPDGCCHAIWDQGLEILQAAAGGLMDCHSDQGCACGHGGMRGFISLGPLNTWQTNVLVVHLEPPGLTLSPRSLGANGMMQGAPNWFALWRVQLMESGYPGMVEVPGGWATPNDDELHAANRFIYPHGESVLRGLLGLTSTCTNFTLRDLTFMAPTGGPDGWSAGWSIGLAMVVRI
jgi:hypothetical protein